MNLIMQDYTQIIKGESEQAMQDAEYMRIGTSYYRIVHQPLISGDSLETVVKWSREAIVDDHTKRFLIEIPRYLGFCTIPSNIKYQRVINGFYNRYEPPRYFPDTLSGSNTDNILGFIRHIFGEQYELGLDFISILYLNPTQILPILSLVSVERKTGKTTFLNLMKEIFGANMTINTNEDFRSQFNSDWATKLIIGVDETFLEKKEDSERIKNLSTGRSYKAESKGIDKKEIEFFGKFILCSNNEEDFIKIDKDEIRYWVRKIPVLPVENVDLLQDMIKEIPAFLHFLQKREITIPRTTRMWFSETDIYTSALDKLKKGNRTYTENELGNIIKDVFLEFTLSELKYTQRDLKTMARANFIPATDTMVNRFLDSLNKTSRNSSYTRYTVSNSGEPEISEVLRGRYFTFSIDDFVPEGMDALVSGYFKDFEKTVFEFDDLPEKMNFVKEFNKLNNTNLNLRDFELLVLNLKIKFQENDNRASKDNLNTIVYAKDSELPY